MIGIVNHIVEHMMKYIKKDALEWIKSCNVQLDKRHGGTSFNGNSCRTLLNKIDLLRNSNEYGIGCLEYADVLQKFNKVVTDCFGSKLDGNFVKSIDEFKNQYLKLNISVTIKAHIVVRHDEK